MEKELETQKYPENIIRNLEDIAPDDIIVYYLAAAPREKVASVCLLVKDGIVVSRGVTICSPKDHFCRREGRIAAMGRAIQATKRKANVDAIIVGSYFKCSENYLEYLSIKDDFGFLACYMPKLTEHEKSLINNRKKKQSSKDTRFDKPIAYYCTKCQRNHYVYSIIGKRHKKYKR